MHVVLAHQAGDLRDDATTMLVEWQGSAHNGSLREDVSAGPGRLLPRPVRQLALTPRNVEALRRLGYLAEGRRRERLSPGAGAGPTPPG